jgi:hypothetical protein
MAGGLSDVQEKRRGNPALFFGTIKCETKRLRASIDPPGAARGAGSAAGKRRVAIAAKIRRIRESRNRRRNSANEP